MRNTIIILICFLGLMLIGKATPPTPEPLEIAFDRFAKTYVLQCEKIMRGLSGNYPDKERDIEILSKILENIKADCIPGVRRTIKDDPGGIYNLSYWLKSLTGNIIEFRRYVDQVIIINLANNNLHLSEDLQNKLKKYWNDERYYSWRFGSETDSTGQIWRKQEKKHPLHDEPKEASRQPQAT